MECQDVARLTDPWSTVGAQPRQTGPAMSRRTKIIATIGPASESEEMLANLMGAGMDVARIGLAHNTMEEHLERYHRIRKVAAEVGRNVGIMVDLPGPKVRMAKLEGEGVTFERGTDLLLTPGSDRSTAERIEVDYEWLLSDLRVGDRVSLGDGKVAAEILHSSKRGFEARVTYGGRLQGRPGVHIPSERLRITTPTPSDLKSLDVFVEAGVDMVAVSFVRSAHDLRRVGTEAHPRGPLVIAKIETRAAVENIDGIIAASGAIMVARGDLGSEMPIAELPHLQKSILQRCISLGRPAITATQMLESMIDAPSPTRAEASDVANAVFDGSSAVMLSGESAIGVDPVNAVRTMADIAGLADERFPHGAWGDHLARLGNTDLNDDDVVTNAMTEAASRAAVDCRASAIICVTRTGFTTRSIARYRPESKILAFTADERVARQLSLSWGVEAFWRPALPTQEEAIRASVEMAAEKNLVQPGDLVAVLSGSPTYRGQATDSLRLVRV